MFPSLAVNVWPRSGGKLPASVSSSVEAAFKQLPLEGAVDLEMLGEPLLFALDTPQLQVNHPRGESPLDSPSTGPELICWS